MRKTSVGNRGVTIRPASAFSGREPVLDWGRVRPFPGGAALEKGAPARCPASAQPFGKTVDNPFVLKGTIEKGRISGNG